jgi:epoxyqueuosine reductase
MVGYQKVLVDVCCGPCSLPLEEIYKNSEGLDVAFFVSDHNVHPVLEYKNRLESIKKVAEHYGNKMIVEDYSPKEWFNFIKGLEDEPENGKRCEKCYTFRLERTAIYASENGYDSFTTTLTTGPSKEADMVNMIGEEIAKKNGLLFIKHDLKKNNGFWKSIVLSKQLGLYRQKYCGCVYSMLDKIKHQDEKKENKNIESNKTLDSKKDLNDQRNIIMASPKL